MSYFRRGMGDGPITDPSQLENGTTVAVTTPTRVDCSQLPSDSPFRQPGQACAPGASSNGSGGAFDWLLDTIKSGGAATPSTSTASTDASDNTKWILGGVAAVAAYYFLFHKKKRA